MPRMQSFERVAAAVLAGVVGLAGFGLTTARAADTNGADLRGETKEQHDARMAWWRDARFGMFIHWGVYSVPAGTYKDVKVTHIGEWIMNDAKIPVAEYAGYAKQFDPEKFNADEWVSIAKNAGMKYIVITSKHHDGFAMFHSKTSPYNIYDATPFKRDPIAELAQACQKQGVKFGLYYSQSQDWHHPGGAAAKGHPDAAGITNPPVVDDRSHWDQAQVGSYDEYLQNIALPQVKEIFSNYGPLAVIWWDTPMEMTPERSRPFIDAIKQLQPQIISNNRLTRQDPEFIGDTETPEQFIPPGGFPGRDWETCMTMNDTWGFKSWDTNFKSVDKLLTNLIDIASKGGNYLLNVGPDSLGQIPQPEVDRLAAVGEWLKANGESIYGSSASPFRRKVDFGRVTQKPGRLFLHVFDWKSGGKLWLPMTSKISKAYLLTTPDKTFEVGTADGGATIALTGDAPDKIASVVVAELDGPLQVFDPPLKAADDGVFTLDAVDADLAGNAKASSRRNRLTVGNLTSDTDGASWKLHVDKPAKYAVELNYSCDAKSAGGAYEVVAGDQKLSSKVESTGTADDLKTAKVGDLSLDKPGDITITLRPTKSVSGSVMNLKALKLTPQ